MKKRLIQKVEYQVGFYLKKSKVKKLINCKLLVYSLKKVTMNIMKNHLVTASALASLASGIHLAAESEMNPNKVQ